jgi:AraC family transcriptional regulator
MNLLEDIPAAIPSLINAAVAAFDADRDTSRRYLLRASALLRGACAEAEGARPSASRGGLLAWQLNRVIDHIETHLAEKMTVTDLADLINVSVGQLIRAFKISVGIPPFHYIASRRVELACTMMSTRREPLSQIAIACGLCDQAHLCKVFRRMIGMSPSAWRREQEMGAADPVVLRGYTSSGPAISAAKVSAMASTAACTGPEVMAGITEASTTWRPSKPWSFSSGSTTLPALKPMRQVPTG